MIDLVNIFKGMSGGTNSDPKELAKLMVKTTAEYAISKNRTNYTYSAYDLSKLDEIKTLIDDLAVKIYNENKKRQIERLRDFSYHYYSSDADSVNFPLFDLNDFLFQLIANNDIFSAQLVSSAQNILNKLSEIIIAAYGGVYYGNYYGEGSNIKRGISIFFTRGNLLNNGTTQYASQNWYRTPSIDFANYTTNQIVETWRELFEAWYDPLDLYTTGSY